VLPADGEAIHAARAAEAAARRSYGKLIAFLAARTRDVAGAEDALSEAFAAALTDWPVHGVPQNPDAWLFTVARRKMVDAARRRRLGEDAAGYLQWLAELASDEDGEAVIPDERLGLMFACAHPAIERSVRAPLMLQAVLGFDAATIASAFLTAPGTMGQRLVRAKSKIRDANIRLGLPDQTMLAERLDTVLEAIYAAYSEGWADPEGSDARRRNLADEAIWLGRLVASLLPDDAEALGLLALMLNAAHACPAGGKTRGRWRVRGAERPGCAVVGPGHDRRGGGAAVARKPGRQARALPVGSGRAIRSCSAAARWPV
jgi:RNA polymerase sigma-70 factor (ECF subfamily)